VVHRVGGGWLRLVTAAADEWGAGGHEGKQGRPVDRVDAEVCARLADPGDGADGCVIDCVIGA
jgi:hypothetical protein